MFPIKVIKLTAGINNFQVHPRVRLARLPERLLVGGEAALSSTMAVLHDGLRGVAG